MCAGDFITYRLTGLPIIDYSMASHMLVFDIRNKVYSDEILSAAGLGAELFSEVHPAGEVVAEIRPEVAEYTGLERHTKVVVGSHDQTCSALGVGNIREGVVSDGMGTVECIGITVNEPKTTVEMIEKKQPIYPHAVRDKYFSFGVHLASGMMLRWFRDIFCQEEIRIANENNLDAYDLIVSKAAKSPSGARGIFVLPHLRGSGTGMPPALNSFSRCAIIGLNAAHTKNDVARAVLEGVAFESKVSLDGLAETGVQVEEIRATGGATKSDFWLQIRADIFDKRIVVPKFKDAGLMGAIILASLGLGIFSSEEEAVENLVEIEKTISPGRQDVRDFYKEHFELHKRIYPTLLPLYEDLRKT